MNIEIITEKDGTQESICVTTKTYVPQRKDVIWMPFNWERKKEFGTRTFLIDEVCHHISPTLENYDSAVLFVTPILPESE